jgi:hypothetical protein
MNNEKILEEILENTKTVKAVVVEKEEKIQKAKAEKAEKSKSAKAKAEAKFKMVGTKLNESELIKFNAKLEDLGINASKYFKGLINFDMVANKELIERQEKSIEDYKLKYEAEQNKVRLLNNDIDKFKEVISSLKTELDKELTKTFWDKIRALF